MKIKETIKLLAVIIFIGLALYIFSPMGVIGGFYVGFCVSAWMSFSKI